MRRVRLYIAGKDAVEIHVPCSDEAQAVDWVLTQLEIEGQTWWAVPQQPHLLMVRRLAVVGVEVVA